MQFRRLGQGGLTASAMGLGCMGMSSFYGAHDDAESLATIRRALDLGITMLDTADMYGPWTNERLIGRAITGRRDEVVIATKCGQEVDDSGVWTRRMNGSPDYLRKSVDGSLSRLGIDHIDLLYLHRVDPATAIEESFGTLGELVAAGKISHLGICEAAPATIRRAHAVAPLAAVQTEYSLFTRDVEDNGVLAACRDLGIGFVGYAPLGRGFLSGKIRAIDDLAEDDIRRNSPRFQGENFHRNLEVLAALESLAAAKGVTTGQLALAWVLAQGNDVCAIPGTRRIVNLEENTAALDVKLSAEDLLLIESAAPPRAISGPRYGEQSMRTTFL